MTTISNLKVGHKLHYYQGVSFVADGQKYTANIAIDGKSPGPSSLYVFGAPGDDCITTVKVDDAELLSEVEAAVAAHNSANGV